MRPLAVCVVVLLGFGPAVGAQTVQSFEGGRLVPVECGNLSARVGQLHSITVCYEPRSGPRFRCEDVTAEQSVRLCEKVRREGGGGGVTGRLSALAQDLGSGFTRPGGRRAGTDTCPAGMPEGDVLADMQSLQFTSTGVDELTLADERGRLISKGEQVQVESAPLRGAAWELRGRSSGRTFVCRFSVLSAAEAQALLQEVRVMPSDTRAGLLERAEFFRRQSLWYEYWKTIDALRRN